MGPTAQFRPLTAATGMSVHLICLGNELMRSTPISLTCIAHERVQQGLYTVFKIYNNKSLKRVWITQILVISAATGMSVHPICLGNALEQSTPIVHAYRGEIMSQGGSNVVSLRGSSHERWVRQHSFDP